MESTAPNLGVVIDETRQLVCYRSVKTSDAAVFRLAEGLFCTRDEPPDPSAIMGLIKGRTAMNRNCMRPIVIATGVLAVLGAKAISAQDKYTLQVPGGLAFSEFRGYESWETVAISRSENLVAVILANPVMIDAYRAGIPGNGKP